MRTTNTMRRRLILLVAVGLASIAWSGCNRSSLRLPEEGSAIVEDVEQLVQAAEFQFPEDKAGPLLNELLAPPKRLPLVDNGPIGTRKVSSLDLPAWTMPPAQVGMISRKDVALPEFRPRNWRDDLPGAGLEGSSVLVVRLAVPPAPRQPADDVKVPLTLPYLSTSPVDMQPADDPTTPASLAAASQSQNPARSAPVGFLKLNLPVPEEFQLPSRSPRAVPDEPPAFEAAARTPKR